ncbi:hypothetical protein ACBY01_05625 [Sphingomonas sp. ac-8]|uniref:hypothetical protein n=1 Tax=Sphingomonas sp. ac-8 TaxID=3242977 RepID=UPI003A7FA1F4
MIDTLDSGRSVVEFADPHDMLTQNSKTNSSKMLEAGAYSRTSNAPTSILPRLWN